MTPKIENQIVKFLLEKQVVYIEELEYISLDYPPSVEKILTFVVDCGDIIYYAADNIKISSFDDLKDLYDFCYKESSWGVTKWYCKKMQKQPLPQLKKMMIEENVWEPWLEELEKHPVAE